MKVAGLVALFALLTSVAGCSDGESRPASTPSATATVPRAFTATPSPTATSTRSRSRTRESVYVHALASIDGETEIQLVGQGPLETDTDPPVFQDLIVCGTPANRPVACDAIRNGTESGYVLTIAASPEN